MWHGVNEYVALAAVVGLVIHMLTHRYVGASAVGAGLSSVGNLAHEAWLTGFDVNPGWALPMFLVGSILAFPACLVVGLPFPLWRRRRRPPRAGAVVRPPAHPAGERSP